VKFTLATCVPAGLYLTIFFFKIKKPKQNIIFLDIQVVCIVPVLVFHEDPPERLVQLFPKNR